MPLDVQLDDKNINKYLANPGSIYDNALMNERNLSDDNFKYYGAKNKDAATHFASIEDAVAKVHELTK